MQQRRGRRADGFTGKTALSTLVLRLFSSNTTLAETDTARHLHREYAATGYAAIVLTAASWTTVEGAPSQTSYAQQTFTMTGAGDAYGYYMTLQHRRPPVSRSASAQRALSIPAGGGTIKITPQVTAD